MSNSFKAAYTGTKNFTQQQVRTANATGFGAAADDYAERGIDLNEHLIMNKPATFFFRVNNNTMAAAGIHKNNVLIVDRSIRPADGKIVVATIDGELLIRRVLLRNGKLMLTIDGDAQSWVAINEFQQITVWGIVTCIINMVEPALLQYANAAMK